MPAERCRIVPSDIGDVYRIAARMRDGDRLEATSLGADPTALLRTSYRHAILRRTAFVDGEIAAIWGLGGVLLSDEGTPWLVTTPAVERVPVTFVRTAREQVAEMLSLRSYLSNVVQASYTGACRLLEILGFTLEAAQPIGPHGVPFRKFWMAR